jgi:hypothetical protein
MSYHLIPVRMTTIKKTHTHTHTHTHKVSAGKVVGESLGEYVNHYRLHGKQTWSFLKKKIKNRTTM